MAASTAIPGGEMSRSLLIPLALTLVVACSNAGPSPDPGRSAHDAVQTDLTPVRPRAATGSASDEEIHTLVRNNTAFALALMMQLGDSGENQFISPMSISTALAMTFAGAAGDTAHEMQATLEFTLPARRTHAAFGALERALADAGEGAELAIANRLWVRRDIALKPGFESITRERYRAEAAKLDFAADTEAARRTINDWVADQTAQKIRDLLAPGVVTPRTSMVLTNAIYFKGQWRSAFDPELTKPQPFSLADGTEITAPMMQQKGTFGFLRGEDFRGLVMPYKGHRLVALLLLPDARDGIDALLSSLTADRLPLTIQRARTTTVRVEVPRIKLTRTYQLGGQLAELGMPTAFTAGADFSTMAETSGLRISAVVHKTFLDFNEEGTEAAGATGVEMLQIAMTEPARFEATHPYLIFLMDKETGAVLFAGRVMDPR
jgi:serpin B